MTTDFDGQTRCARCGMSYRGMTCDVCAPVRKTTMTTEQLYAAAISRIAAALGVK